MAAHQSVARVGAPPIAVRPGWFKASKRFLGRDWPIAYLFFLPTALLLFGLIGYLIYRRSQALDLTSRHKIERHERAEVDHAAASSRPMMSSRVARNWPSLM